MNEYSLMNFSFIPHWDVEYFETDEMVLMVKVGTNVPIYMEMQTDKYEYHLMVELSD